MAPKDGGYSHCGVKAHRAGHKFVPQANCYYLPGGITQGRHTARSDNCLPKDCVPSIMKITFEEGLHTSRKWCHLIIDALTHADNEDGEEDGSDYGMVFNEEVGSKSTYTSYTDDGMVINHDGGLALNFDWDEEISDLGIGTDWGPPARAHRTALNLLNKAVTAAYASHKPDMEELAEDIIGRLGDLEILIAKHGTMLGDCFRRQPLIIAYANGRAFGDDLRDYAAAANITKESLLSVPKFAEAPPPKQGFYIYPNSAFNEWWVCHLLRPPL